MYLITFIDKKLMEFGHLWWFANEGLGQRNMPGQVVRVPTPWREEKTCTNLKCHTTKDIYAPMRITERSTSAMYILTMAMEWVVLTPPPLLLPVLRQTAEQRICAVNTLALQWQGDGSQWCGKWMVGAVSWLTWTDPTPQQGPNQGPGHGRVKHIKTQWLTLTHTQTHFSAYIGHINHNLVVLHKGSIILHNGSVSCTPDTISGITLVRPVTLSCDWKNEVSRR